MSLEHTNKVVPLLRFENNTAYEALIMAYGLLIIFIYSFTARFTEKDKL